MNWLHLHVYWNEINTQNRFDDYTECNIESVYIHNSFKNVSQNIGNNVLYYDTGLFITLSDGYYNLDGLNRILKKTGTLYYKLTLSDDSQLYELWKFSTESNWNTDNYTSAVNKTSIVKDLSILNKHIYNMTFFNSIRAWLNFISEFSSQKGNNEIIHSNDIEIPITAAWAQYQTIYFTPPINYKCNIGQTIQVDFYTWND